MEQLKPILAQKFWILLGVGIILCFVGWYMAAGALEAAIDTRVKAIDKAKADAAIAETPNETWQAAVGKINEQQSVLVDEAKYKLWQQETSVMEWPKPVFPFVQQAKGYKGDMRPGVLTLYRDNYPLEVTRVWRTVRPIDPIDGTGIVDFPISRMAPIKSWGSLTPTYQEIWECQEDMWLFKSLLKSILTINGGIEATKQDASIHVINALQLHGGDRSLIGAAPDAAGGMGGMGGEDMGGMGGAMGAGAMGMGGGGGPESGMGGMGGSGGRPTAANVDFDPKEEFGSPGGAAGGGMGGMGSGMSAMSADMMGGEGGDPSAAAAPPRRYIDDDEAQPYQTRGFYLSVVMDHRRLPHLLCELTANDYSPYPVEIVRVQMARLNQDNPGGNAQSGMMTGGMPGGGGFAGGSSFPGASSSPMPGEAFAGPGLGGGFGGNPEDMMMEGGFPGMAGGMSGGGRSGPDPYLLDPFMARVAIAGIMKIYRKASPPPPVGQPAATPAPEEVPAAEAIEPPPEPPATEGEMPADGTTVPATPAEGTPAEGTPAPGEPGTPAPAAPAEPGTTPAAPGEGTPPEGATPPPATPDQPAPPQS